MGAEDHYVEDENLSLAWGRALRLVSKRGRDEVAPLVVSVTGFDAAGLPREESAIRVALDGVLKSAGKHACHTVANTIFPESLWSQSAGRDQLFKRYNRIRDRVHHATRQNAKGTYFERLISGGPPGRENQLDAAITTFTARTGVRRSVLQLAIFDPHKDHSNAAQLGFPCLQHVTFAPTDDGLCVNGFYATQYMVERAYGNYLGLCWLGRFVAHELGQKLVRMTCFTGIAERDKSKKDLGEVFEAIDNALGQEPVPDTETQDEPE